MDLKGLINKVTSPTGGMLPQLSATGVVVAPFWVPCNSPKHSLLAASLCWKEGDKIIVSLAAPNTELLHSLFYPWIEKEGVSLPVLIPYYPQVFDALRGGRKTLKETARQANLSLRVHYNFEYFSGCVKLSPR